jgi:hypothetical protein
VPWWVIGDCIFHASRRHQGVPVNGSKRHLSFIRSIICTPARFSLELL